MRPESIEWRDIPPDLRRIVEPHLLRWWPLMPTWVQYFRVTYLPRLDASCQIDLNYPNRFAVLQVAGEFFDLLEEERASTIRHEILHIALEPVRVACGRIIESLAEEETALRALMEGMFLDALESSVEDLARGVGRLLNKENQDERG